MRKARFENMDRFQHAPAGAFARQGWSGPTSQAPPQLRGWLALRDQFLHAPNQKILRYTAGDETFVFRF